MVDQQIAGRQIKNPAVLAAFYKVARDKFVPEGVKLNAYADFPLPIGEGQTISQPYIVALMAECLGLTGEEKVLEIGTGSGYETAILAELTKEVYTVERITSLAERAEAILKESGYTNIRVKVDDGTLGWLQFAPFDRIIVTAASGVIPSPLIEQLKEGGKLIMPLGGSLHQVLTLVEKKGNRLESSQICGCAFVPLIGKYAFNKNDEYNH